MSPREVPRVADKAGRVTVRAEVSRIGALVSTRTRPAPPPVIHARLGASIRVEQAHVAVYARALRDEFAGRVPSDLT
jgi:hypothetical protein